MPVVNRNTPVATVQVPVPTPVQTKSKQSAPAVAPIQPIQRSQPQQPQHFPVSFGGENDEFGRRVQGVSAVILPWSPQSKRMSRGKPKRYSGETTEEDFQRQLDENPDDHHTRMVFADWLQERNDPRAEGYRALGQLGKRPYNIRNGSNDSSMWTHQENINPTSRYGVTHRLPSDWFNLINNTSDEYDRNTTYNHWVYHSNRREAEDEAALGFSRLSEERKKEILQPKKLQRIKPIVKYARPNLTPTQKERAKRVELVLLPKNIEGKKCGTCKYVKKHSKKESTNPRSEASQGLYCTNHSVHMNVKGNWACKLWDAKGVKRLSRKPIVVVKS